MTNRGLGAAVLAGLGAATICATLQAQAIQRVLYVSVLDSDGAPVLDAGPDDIIVREDGNRREVLRVVPADEPLYIALLVDNSQAADPYIGEYRRALPAFVNAIAEASSSTGVRHQISLIGLAARPTIITQYTTDAAEVVRNVNRIFAQPDTGTTLLDAIVSVNNGFRRGRLARPVIVTVVTPGPELSQATREQVLESLRSSGAAFHAVTLGLPVNLSLDRGIVLEQGSRESGGNYDNLLAASALRGRMLRLAAELANQYRVVYARPQALIPPERIVVTGARSDLTVRATVPLDTVQGQP